jgi:hypothetical protein
VVCGLSDTIVTLRPQAALMMLDFPTFGRPTRLTNPQRIVATTLVMFGPRRAVLRSCR